ncbi:DUF3037 domain-containing protein [Fulvivirgaceae bacterium PWU5]|uniref:DUF3037 domain-containing protein n=1 Tax=Dawidia cretensis TaxID=2782350 RepID=A0AAP2DVW4_9BACT|nr:DUF3037 domain-containing protein [Dawidia cretensis]MBT1706639.1 DUF3037 domain-containing protein [Dawidia cretensis]
MSNYFLYSILQYKHSLTLGESLNIGLLFHFPSERIITFIQGDSHRLESIYPNFDSSLFDAFLRNISQKVSQKREIGFETDPKISFKNYIHDHILGEDETALQFSEPVFVINFDSPKSHEETIQSYARLLIPSLDEKAKYHEELLLRKYKSLVFDNHTELKHKFKKDSTIIANGLTLKFELAWKNGSTNFIQPISFDLATEEAIQDKSIRYYGTLNLLGDYAKNHNYRFDLLVAKPRNTTLLLAYENALDNLKKANAPKEIITEDKIEQYSNKTILELSAI